MYLSSDVSQVEFSFVSRNIYEYMYTYFHLISRTRVEDVSPKPVVDLFQIYMSINIVVLN